VVFKEPNGLYGNAGPDPGPRPTPSSGPSPANGPQLAQGANDNTTPQGTCDYAMAMCRAYDRVQDFTPQEQIDYSAGCGAAFEFCQYKVDSGNINNKQGDTVFFPDGGSVKFQQRMPPRYIPRP